MMLKFLSLNIRSTLGLVESVLYTSFLLRIVNIAVIICFGLRSVAFTHLVRVHVPAFLSSINIPDALGWQFLILLLEVGSIWCVHTESGFAQLVYQIFNITLVVRLWQALIHELILLLVLTLGSLYARHTTGGSLIHQTGLIFTVRSTAFLWIKVARHFTSSREAIKLWYHLRIRLRLLLVFGSWSTTTNFKNRIKMMKGKIDLLEGTGSNDSDTILGLVDVWNTTWRSLACSLLILNLIQILHTLKIRVIFGMCL